MKKQAFAAVAVLVVGAGVFIYFRWKNNQTPEMDSGPSKGTSGPPTNTVQLPPVFKAPITTNLSVNRFLPTTTENAGNVKPMPPGTSAWGSMIASFK